MIKILHKLFDDYESYPNNSELPVLQYKKVLNLKGRNPEKSIQELFVNHFWYRPWQNGIYDFHHYHSNNHEVLGIIRGSCQALIGGPKGDIFDLEKGDVLILPAGVSHKKIKASKDFSCVGAYSIDEEYDLKHGEEKHKPSSIKTIRSLPLPNTDPVFGEKNPLLKYWK